MGTRKKKYYNKLLEKNKNNIKGILSVLNDIIRTGARNKSYPEYSVEKDNTIDKMADGVSGCSNFFLLMWDQK